MMRVVTTCHKAGLEQYGQRWLDSRQNWPEGTDFRFYTEGFTVDCPGKDVSEIGDFAVWKAKHSGYIPPSWQWNVVGFAHKVFAAADALRDYDGIGVWLDADCVTYKPIPAGLIERQVADAFLACYQRTGMYTETGLWIMNCAHAQTRNFFDSWRAWYLTEAYKRLPQWHDCFTLDATVRAFVKDERIKVHNLSGEHAQDMHPQAKTELGQYVDHCKGPRKAKGRSPENKFRKAA